MNPLRQLGTLGQSPWLDSIRRSLITSGELRRLVEDDGLRGVTSNPAIFEKAIAAGDEYRNPIASLALDPTLDAKAIYERLAIADIRAAADVLEPVYLSSDGRDGFVSLEVSPHLSHDTAGTLAEARRLWNEVSRPNLMIKVPATAEGVPAIETLLAEGIHVNVTLLFSLAAYEKVAEAYLRGLERLAAAGGRLESVASVASFFVSRIDTAVDALLEERAIGHTGAERERLLALRGKAAIANAKMAYQRYLELFHGERWAALVRHGARPQRLLWASTGTKSAAYRDVVYVEELIGEDTVNTVPPATFDAFRAHGVVRPSLRENPEEARQRLAELRRAGIDLDAVTTELLGSGLRLFEDAFDRLLGAVETACIAAPAAKLAPLPQLPTLLRTAVDEATTQWRTQHGTERLWARDASLWTGSDEANWLGWLDVIAVQQRELDRFKALAAESSSGAFAHVLLLGMGGSSLFPDVLRSSFGARPGFPELVVLDSTDPAQILATEARVDLDRTLVVVSSKSGNTLEPEILLRHFFARIAARLGEANAAARFLAITDPGSKLEQEATRLGFRRVCHAMASIGGRYSALSDFGLVPAALAGLDVARLLERAEEMLRSCAPGPAENENPGVRLGLLLGVLGRSGRNKVTLIASPGIAGLADWLEQLLAESTGKRGQALIPIAGERLGPPAVYGEDRLFVSLELAGEDDPERQAALAALVEAGQPLVRLALADTYDIAREVVRWEIATAVAGAVLGVNPFDQPDVESSKVATRRITDEYEASGALPAEIPLATEGGLALYADASNAAALTAAAGKGASLVSLLRAHLARLRNGDYFALLAYVERAGIHADILQAGRHRVRDARRAATCLGFGPRFLHSTGQAYKGGPNSGVFIQVTCDDRIDVPVPGQRYSFGVVKAAQALGDLAVLVERGRRVVRVHLGGDVGAGLRSLDERIAEALQ